METTLQRTVFFDALAILVKRGGADALYLATRQGGLQHVGGIHGACGGSCTDDGMYLVDEKDDIGVLLQLVDNGADALFELAAVLGACHDGRHVEHDDALVEEYARHLALRDAQGQSFDDGRLAHAGFTYQHRIVFLATAQNLCQTLNLAFTAYNRIQLALGGGTGDVGTEVIEYRRVVGRAARSRLCRGRRTAHTATPAFLSGARRADFLFFVIVFGKAHASIRIGRFHRKNVVHILIGNAIVYQHCRCHTVAIFQDSQQQMLRVGQFALQQAGFEHAYFKDSGSSKREGYFCLRQEITFRLYALLQVSFDSIYVRIKLHEHFHSFSAAIAQNAKQQMFRGYKAATQPIGLFLAIGQYVRNSL